MKSLLYTVLFFTALTPVLRAGTDVELKGHKYPGTLEAGNQIWDLKGTEHFKYKVVFSVFTSALYEHREEKGLKLRFTYTRSLKAGDLREQAMKTLRRQHSAETLEKYEALTDQIQAAYVDVKDGDAYTITVVEEMGTWLHLNDKELFFTENPEFGYWYLGIWLGENPISDSLKEALVKK